MDKHNKLIQEQLNYYRARAQEYDDSLKLDMKSQVTEQQPQDREWLRAVRALHSLGPRHDVLELAGGTGIWKKELTSLATNLTVLDGSPEMLAINRSKFNDPRVHYQCVDIFSWVPQRTYDLVFFAFWLSHVPPSLLNPFLDKLSLALNPGGFLFMVDEPAGGRMLSGPAQDGMYQQRAIQDGRTFNIVKVYYDPFKIKDELGIRGFGPIDVTVGDYFYYLQGERST